MSNTPAQGRPSSSGAADDDLASIERDLASAQDAVRSSREGSHTVDDLDQTQSLPSYDDSALSDSDRRITRDELYRDNPDEADRVASVRADYEANPLVADSVTPVAPAPPADSKEKRSKPRKAKLVPTTDKFLPSFGLFALRVVTGVIMGVHGVQKLLSLDETVQFFSNPDLVSFFGSPLPQPQLLAILTGAAEALMGVALIFGFATRLAGFGVLLISVGALLMVKMRTIPNPFASGEPGFQGELELLLAGVGLALLLLGGGAFAIDRLFRRGRYTHEGDIVDA